MAKLLIGGSPCTHWSIAQRPEKRETEASGLGWELFLNYKLALESYQPDFFLYENNKSMDKKIRTQITKELGVEPVLINSVLVSAQTRQRLYWVGKRMPDGSYETVQVSQPCDKGVFMDNILDFPSFGELAWSQDNLVFPEATKKGFVTIKPFCCFDMTQPNSKTRCGRDMEIKSNCLVTSPQFYQYLGPVSGAPLDGNNNLRLAHSEVGVKIIDDRYVLKRLSVGECKRLQTIPEWFSFPVSDAQSYKMLGNGWTVDVISHIMSHFDGVSDSTVDVLAMYDGMSCGQIALRNLGVKVRRYFAVEIDKHAIFTTQANFPDTIQLGDAFAVRTPKFWDSLEK